MRIANSLPLLGASTSFWLCFTTNAYGIPNDLVMPYDAVHQLSAEDRKVGYSLTEVPKTPLEAAKESLFRRK